MNPDPTTTDTPAVNIVPPVRVFRYNDREWTVTDPTVTTADVRQQLVRYLPELANAGTQEQTRPDGALVITFIKRAGTKGGGADLAARLTTVPAAYLRGVVLLTQLGPAPAPAALVAHQGELRAALSELAHHTQQVHDLVRRCCSLTPRASQTVPPGF